MGYVVYILYSIKLDRFYVGSSSNLGLRMAFHHSSPGYKFTGKAADWQLFFKSDCADKKQAVNIEKHIKKMKSRKYIQNLKRYPEMVENLKKKYS
ncbi:GIY-YIG nuclease family protein [Salinimicrobium flavum]|uniref:GIY-YIG nuclease family protein n=1 Tax=Salinimicrobium flavum TaxID=1737065 RepID=A0ABW5IVQ8_9FLAO